MNLTLDFVKVFGGVSGFIALILFIKKFKGKIKIYQSYGYYQVIEKKLIITVGLIVYNGKEEPISITDISACLKYNKEKFKSSQEKKMTYSSKSVHFKNFPTNVSPKQSAQINLKYIFNNIQVDLLERFGTARILGFYQGVPTLIVDERENELNWNKNPLLG